MKYIIVLLAAVLLSGCAGDSSEYVTHYLDKGFVGHPVNEFFSIYGFPAGRFEQVNGNVVYRWVSTQSKIPLITQPSKASPGTYTSPNGEYQIVDTYKGGVERQYCELRINTDRGEIIRGFDIAVDSVGKWSTSRCSEIFNRVYP